MASAVAGRFDHYICRRDDNLRDRKPDEVPRIQAAALRAAGVPETAISVIPDEQEAIAAALAMGQPGDLLLVFADALVRSWKQVTKFRPAGAPAAPPAPAPSFVSHAETDGAGIADAAGGVSTFSLEGLIRDERGVRFAPEAED
jgi:cyanophycin synthetase